MTRHVFPAIFSAPMILALLREVQHPGTGKTQTRRLAWREHKTNVHLPPTSTAWTKLKAGDLGYVRESWRPGYGTDWYREDLERVPRPSDFDPNTTAIEYIADGEFELGGTNRPSIHMPRWASRLTLEITADVRIEKLNAISERDARAEGVLFDEEKRGFHVPGVPHPNKDFPFLSRPTAREMFAALWDTINGSGAWLRNPDVVVTTFKPHLKNIDDFIKGLPV